MRKLLRPFFRRFARVMGITRLENRIADLENELQSLQRSAAGMSSLLVQFNDRMLDHVDVMTRERAQTSQDTIMAAVQTLLSNERTISSNMIQRQLVELTSQLHGPDSAADGLPGMSSRPVEKSSTIDNDFYVAFENAFRGDPQLVLERQSEYLPYITDVVSVSHPLLDIGCGRGEWLHLLRTKGVIASGVDTNATNVRDCTARGLAVTLGDAITVLTDTPKQSLGAITLFQVLEHLALDDMVHLLTLARESLIPGGVLIAEIPNLETLRVGAHTFWLDPTHIRPLSPLLLRFTAQLVGFASVDGVYSSPLMADPDLSGLPARARETVLAMHHQLNGFGDFAIIAKA